MKKKVIISPVIEKAKPIVKIKSDLEEFFPNHDEANNHLELKAKVEPDVNKNKFLTITSRTTAIINCGFCLTLPTNCKSKVVLNSDLASKGLILIDIKDNCPDGHFAITVANIGKEILVIKDKEKVGYMYLIHTPEFRVEV